MNGLNGAERYSYNYVVGIEENAISWRWGARKVPMNRISGVRRYTARGVKNNWEEWMPTWTLCLWRELVLMTLSGWSLYMYRGFKSTCQIWIGWGYKGLGGELQELQWNLIYFLKRNRVSWAHNPWTHARWWSMVHQWRRQKRDSPEHEIAGVVGPKSSPLQSILWSILVQTPPQR
jgi:hypothetical protein